MSRLTERDLELYYNGFCNAVLWPLLHSIPERALFSRLYWSAYQEVNSKFAEATLDALRQVSQYTQVSQVSQSSQSFQTGKASHSGQIGQPGQSGKTVHTGQEAEVILDSRIRQASQVKDVCQGPDGKTGQQSKSVKFSYSLILINWIK